MLNIVIPMAGLGSRFTNAGFTTPKPFIKVGKAQTPMIECVLQNLSTPQARFYLIALKSHLVQEKTLIDKLTHKYNAEFIGIENLTQGAACSVLYASEFIDNDTPLLIANSDQIIDINIGDFIVQCANRKLDGEILCFVDKTCNPKWSFVRVDSSGLVREVREKEAISEFATSGIYLFARGADFVKSAKEMIMQNERVNGEFYVAPTYNYAIKNGAKIGIYEISCESMHGIGTPQDLSEYERFLEWK
ncbi:glycosyltransferase family 2 protein [Helicobacter sp. T3_23-1059]